MSLFLKSAISAWSRAVRETRLNLGRIWALKVVL